MAIRNILFLIYLTLYFTANVSVYTLYSLYFQHRIRYFLIISSLITSKVVDTCGLNFIGSYDLILMLSGTLLFINLQRSLLSHCIFNYKLMSFSQIRADFDRLQTPDIFFSDNHCECFQNFLIMSEWICE